MEQVIKKEQTLYENIKDLLNEFDDLLIIFNSSGRILITNKSASKKLGYPFEILLTRNIFDFHPADRQLDARRTIEALKNKQTINYNIPLVKDTGEIVEIESRISRSLWDGEDIYFGIFRDVTEQKKNQDNLYLTNIRNKTLVDISNQVSKIEFHDDYNLEIKAVLKSIGKFFASKKCFLCLIDNETYKVTSGYEWADDNKLTCLPTIEQINKKFKKYRFWAEQIKNDKPVFFRSLNELPDNAVNERQLLSDQKIFSTLKVGIRDKNKIKGVISINNFSETTPIDTNDIRFLKIVGGIIINKLDQINSYMDLQRSEQKLHYAMQANQTALWELNLNTQIYSFSPQHKDILGYVVEDVDPRMASILEMVHPEDRESVYNILAETVAGKFEKFQIEFRVIHANGQWVWLESFGTVIEKDENTTPIRIVGTHTDITERKNKALRLESENTILKEKAKGGKSFYNIVGQSSVMLGVYDTILQAAESDANVIIYGESGTGKELVANAIHQLSSRHKMPFVPVNCGAIPDSILESEFFGYVKGAFTGAAADKGGYLDAANGGILFLDELGELPMGMQVKLLRAIEGSGYTPVGNTEVKKTNFRIVAATNRDLKEQVLNGSMRSDFYYRIHVLPVTLPPLRERKDDIPLLVYHFMQKFSGKLKKDFVVNEAIFDALQKYDWPGNVRELQNMIQRYMSIGTMDFLNSDIHGDESVEPVDDEITNPPSTEKQIFTIRNTWDFSEVTGQLEKALIAKALDHTNGNKLKAATILNLPRKTLYRKIDKYQITPSFDSI